MVSALDGIKVVEVAQVCGCANGWQAPRRLRGGRNPRRTESNQQRLANMATRGKSGRYPVRAGQIR